MEEEHAFDPYSVLGVDRNASADDIREVWKRLQKTEHPDKMRRRGVVDEAAAKRSYERIKQSFEVLCDPVRRSIYDRFGWQGLREKYAQALRSAAAGNPDNVLEFYEKLMRRRELQEFNLRTKPRVNMGVGVNASGFLDAVDDFFDEEERLEQELEELEERRFDEFDELRLAAAADGSNDRQLFFGDADNVAKRLDATRERRLQRDLAMRRAQRRQRMEEAAAAFPWPGVSWGDVQMRVSFRRQLRKDVRIKMSGSVAHTSECRHPSVGVALSRVFFDDTALVDSVQTSRVQVSTEASLDRLDLKLSSSHRVSDGASTLLSTEWQCNSAGMMRGRFEPATAGVEVSASRSLADKCGGRLSAHLGTHNLNAAAALRISGGDEGKYDALTGDEVEAPTLWLVEPNVKYYPTATLFRFDVFAKALMSAASSIEVRCGYDSRSGPSVALGFLRNVTHDDRLGIVLEMERSSAVLSLSYAYLGQTLHVPIALSSRATPITLVGSLAAAAAVIGVARLVSCLLPAPMPQVTATGGVANARNADPSQIRELVRRNKAEAASHVGNWAAAAAESAQKQAANDGLVIVEAYYGDPSAFPQAAGSAAASSSSSSSSSSGAASDDDDDAADDDDGVEPRFVSVDVQLQYHVYVDSRHRPRLTLPQSSKSSQIGWYDPAPDLEHKKIHIKYLSGGRLHVVDVDEFEAVSLPDDRHLASF
jgi:curved DNA-binding protein CbpA